MQRIISVIKSTSICKYRPSAARTKNPGNNTNYRSSFVNSTDRSRDVIFLLTDEKEYSNYDCQNIDETLDYYWNEGYTSIVVNPVKVKNGQLVLQEDMVIRYTFWGIVTIFTVLTAFLIYQERQKTK